MKIARILVPLDGSALADTALSEVADLAVASSASVVVLRAVEMYSFPEANPMCADLDMREAETYLATVEARLRLSGVRDVKRAVWYGPPAAAISKAARQHAVDLIVMTTHGRSGFGRILLGSVAEAVIRASTIPILVLHPPGAPVELPWPPRAHVMKTKTFSAVGVQGTRRPTVSPP